MPHLSMCGCWHVLAVENGRVQVPVEWEPVSVRPVKAADGSTTVPQEVIDSLRANKVGLKGDS